MKNRSYKIPESDIKYFKKLGMKKYKPKPQYKIFTAVWYNPFFWVAGLLFPIVYGIYQGIKSMIDTYSEFFHGIFKYDLK